ncbi:MAG: hypothetical protein ACFFDC_19605, partial [Promethearchaeota archaeon]
MAKVTIIKPEKGEGKYPTPETRRIFPTRALLWKYYLTVFCIWIVVTVAIIFLWWFILLVKDDPVPTNFQNLFTVFYWVISIVIVIPSLILLPFYVNRMEFVVHGDEVIVKKGLLNKTVKY